MTRSIVPSLPLQEGFLGLTLFQEFLVSYMKLDVAVYGASTPSIMTFSITTISINDTQYYDTQHK